MLLSIIIVNYNVRYFVEQCILSVARSKGIPLEEVEVFVVDNHSSDHSVSHLRHCFPASFPLRVEVIANRQNLGFGRANNQALHQVTGKYVLFLNPDTILTEDTLHEVLQAAESHPEAGVFGVKMLQSDGSFAKESRRGLPTPWTAFCRMTGLGNLFPKTRLFGNYYMQFLDLTQFTPIDIVSGAFMLGEREKLLKMEGFDEDYFMYGEDIDLSYRLLQAGFHNFYVPTPILHYKGESTRKYTYRYVHVFYQAMFIFFKKHFHRSAIWLSVPIRLAILLKAFLSLIPLPFHAIRNYLNPASAHPSPHILYLGRSGTAVRELAARHGIHIDILDADATSLPEGHLTRGIDLKPYLIIAYDTADFPFRFILNRFETAPTGKRHIGLFHPDAQLLVTGKRIFT